MKKILCLLLVILLVALSGCNKNASVDESSDFYDDLNEFVADESYLTNSNQENEKTTESNKSTLAGQTTSSSQTNKTDDKKEESNKSDETPKENNKNDLSSSSTPIKTDDIVNSTKPETSKVSVWKGTTAKWTNGTGTASNPYLIESAEMLAYLAQTFTAGNSYSEKYFLVTVDIDLKNRQWTPIGTKTTPFSGVFDADGHTISNLNLSKTYKDTEKEITYECTGLFGYAKDSEISNLNIDGVSWNFALNSAGSDIYYVGAVVGNAAADYEFVLTNCSVKNHSFSMESNAVCKIYTGGLVGYASTKENSTMELTKLSLDVKMKAYTASETFIGGVVGLVSQKGNTEISNVRAHINLNKSAYNGQYFASSLMGAFSSEKGTVDVESCYFTLDANNATFNTTSSSGYSCKINGFCAKHYGVFEGKAKLTNVFFTYRGGASSKEYVSNYSLIYLLSDDNCVNIINSELVKTLPKTCGFDTNIWDLSDLSSPKLK